MTRRNRRGSGAVMSGLLLTTMVAAGSVAIDIGYQRMVGQQLQAGLDGAAIAASSKLSTSPAAARTAAKRVAALNEAGGSSITLTDAEIVIGNWDKTTSTFTALPSATESSGNAVQIQHGITDVPTFLANAFGVSDLAVARSSIAGTTGGGTASCGVLASTVNVITGTWTADSYDSSKGTYLSTKGSNAGVCSDGSVTANGNAKIYGSLYYGRDPGDSATVASSVTVTGSVDKLPAEIAIPSADSTYASTHNNNSSIGKTSSNKNPMSGTSFSMNSQDTLTLAAGTYYFTSFTLNGQAQLKVSGNVKIYVNGDFKANGGGIVNLTQLPQNLTVYVDGVRAAQVNGTADFYGSVIAPDSAGKLNGTAAFYGVFAAKTLDLSGNGKFHEDLAMVDSLIGKAKGNERVVLFQ